MSTTLWATLISFSINSASNRERERERNLDDLVWLSLELTQVTCRGNFLGLVYDKSNAARETWG